MLDFLYDDIGKKLKGLAKLIFLVVAFITFLTGLIMLFVDEYLIVPGLLTLIGGPIISWISSWILYAFGELVEKTCNNENNTRNILKQMQEKPLDFNNNSSGTHSANYEKIISESQNTDYTPQYSPQTTFSTTTRNTIICSQCNYEQPCDRTVCWHCGAQFTGNVNPIISHQWLCNNCKQLRTQTPCEYCGKE